MRHKSRLVAQGFTQIPGLDYFETFAPVIRLETLRLLLAIAAQFDLKAHVVDIVGAYLNGKLKEEIYMKLPPGYNDGSGDVWKLERTLYGLKQSDIQLYILRTIGYGPRSLNPTSLIT